MFDVLTVGTATRDVYLECPELKVVSDPGHLRKLGFEGKAQCLPLGAKLEVPRPLSAVGGGAANAAVTFARQGFRTAAWFKIGRDHDGRAVVADLAAEGVKCHPVWDEKEMTAYSLILLSPSGERTVLTHRGASCDIALADFPENLRAKWAYICPGHTRLSVMNGLVARLHGRGTRIAVNLSSYYLSLGRRKLARILKQTDVILVNREEAARLTGRDYGDEKGIFRELDRLVPGIAVMTEGARGVIVSDGRHLYRAGVFPEKRLADRLGSGDAFGSGFVAGLLRSGSRLDEAAIREAIRLGSANATAVVERKGAQAGILTRREASAPRWRKLKTATSTI